MTLWRTHTQSGVAFICDLSFVIVTMKPNENAYSMKCKVHILIYKGEHMSVLEKLLFSHVCATNVSLCWRVNDTILRLQQAARGRCRRISNWMDFASRKTRVSVMPLNMWLICFVWGSFIMYVRPTFHFLRFSPPALPQKKMSARNRLQHGSVTPFIENLKTLAHPFERMPARTFRFLRHFYL